MQRLVERIASVDADVDRSCLGPLLADVQRLASWVESRRLVLATLLAERASFPEDAVGAATRSSHRDAARTLERAAVAGSVPVFGQALATGQVAPGHLDVLGDGLRRLEPTQRSMVDIDRLAEVARRATPQEFRRSVDTEVRRVRTDDGMERLVQQRRDTRLRTWVARDGMWHVAGRFDPDTGLRLDGRLRNELERRFADATPETAPSDPLEKQDHLRALALVSLTEGHGTGGLPEVVVVKDHRCTTCPICTPPRPDAAGLARVPPRAAPTTDTGCQVTPSTAGTAEAVDTPSTADALGAADGGDAANGPRATSPPRPINGPRVTGTPSPANGPNVTSAPRPVNGPPLTSTPSPASGSRATRTATPTNQPSVAGGPSATSAPGLVSGVVAAGPPEPVIDWGLDIELPAAVLEELTRHARIVELTVRDGTIDDPDRRLDQGRNDRLANRAQRRALRALYPTCAIPRCGVRFNATHMHHVVWWEHGGTTDLHNLLPLCSRHHHAVHDRGWQLTLSRDRTLRIDLPDGTTMTTGPPRRGAA